MVNYHLVCDPTIRQPGFDLPRQQWSLLNRFRTEQGHCGACRRKWRLTDTDLCPCGETQTRSHIVESCPLTKLNGGLSRLHSADEDAVSWLTNYGKWHAYEKKKKYSSLCQYIMSVWLLPRHGHTAVEVLLVSCICLLHWLRCLWLCNNKSVNNITRKQSQPSSWNFQEQMDNGYPIMPLNLSAGSTLHCL